MNKLPEIPMKFDIGAKVSLEVKAEIPTTSVGRFVDALTDIVRPWSENRGLRGDLIRLQREEVAFEIAQRARRRIQLENREPYPIPLKTLIPLLEKGSQEAPDDEIMIEMWAELLASAATDSSVPPRFIGILAEINGRQAQLLRSLTSRRGSDREESQSHNLERHIAKLLAQEDMDSSDVRSEIRDWFWSRTGVELVALKVDRPDDYNWDYDDDNEKLKATDLDILASLGLLQRVSIFKDSNNKKIGVISVQYHRVTDLADALLEAVTAPHQS